MWGEGQEGNWEDYLHPVPDYHKEVNPTDDKLGNTEFFKALFYPPEFKDFIDLFKNYDLDRADRGFNQLKQLWTKYGGLNFHKLVEDALLLPRSNLETGLYVPLTTFKDHDDEKMFILNFGQQTPTDDQKQ